MINTNKIKFLGYSLIVFIFSNNVLAIECNQITKEWERTICADPNLISLENTLFDAWLSGRCTDIKTGDLEKWHENISKLNLAEIKAAYKVKMKQINLCNGISDDIKYKFSTLQSNGISISYPILLGERAYDSINASIKSSAYSYISDPSTEDENEKKLSCTIFTAKADLFGVEFPSIQGNSSTGYGGFVYTEKQLWDLDTGINLENIFENSAYEIRPNMKDQFWKTIDENEKNEHCEDYNINHEHAGYYIDYDSLKVSDFEESGADKGCGGTYDVSYDEVKDFIVFNKDLIIYLPRLIDAKLINKELGNKILRDQL